MLVLLIKFRFH